MDVKDYFKNYPGSKKCYQTSDGYIFHQEGDANLHARSLEDKKVNAFEKPVDTPKVEGEAQGEKPKAKGKK